MNIFILYAILYTLSALGIIVIATLVLLRRHTKEYKVFAAFAFTLSTWLLLQFAAQVINERMPILANFLLHLAVALPTFFSVLFFAFARLYCHKTVVIFHHLIVPSLWVLLALAPGMVIESATVSYVGIVVNTTPLYYLELLFVAGYITVGLWCLVQDVRSSHIPARRDRTKFLIYSTVQAFVMIVLVILFFADLLIGQVVVPFALLIMVMLFAYAIIKHRLFDIRLVATRALAYVLSLATLVIVYALLTFVVAAQIFNGPTISLAQQASFITVALLLALTFGPLKRFFDKVTRAIFYRDAYDTKQVLDRISSVLVRATTVKGLSRHISMVLNEATKSAFIAVAIYDGSKLSTERITVVGKKTPRLNPVIQELAEHAQTLLVLDELDNQSAHIYQVMQQNNVAVIARLGTADEKIGYLLFGYKLNGSAYTNQDIGLIRIVNDELSVAIQNALRFEEIERFNETLQAEVKEATKELRESNKKLQALDEAKDEFISMASHQLRTPLTSVKGYLSMVLDGDAGKLNTDQRKLLQEAFASSQRMVYMIADFLNISRLKTGKFLLEPSTMHLPTTIKEEVEQLAPAAKSRGLTIKTHLPADFPALKLDENKIRQVIMNFIDNAIFYSKSGGVIEVELAKNAHQIILKVKDQGIGVSSGEQPQIFTKFFRGTNAKHARPDGTGIGLFMAKKIVLAHGGDMIFESQEHKGSTFGFTLPLPHQNHAKK